MDGVPTHLRTATALATLEKALEDAEVLDLKVDQATRRDSSRRDSSRRDSPRRDSSRRDSSVGGEMRGPRPSHRNHPVPDRQSGGVEMKPMASSRNQPSASTFDPNVDTYGNALRRFVRLPCGSCGEILPGARHTREQARRDFFLDRALTTDLTRRSLSYAS